MATGQPLQLSAGRLRQLFDTLSNEHGALDWWPAETPFEVLVGAVLTQNAAWINVEKAIANLRDAGSLDADVILTMEHDALAALIRPAGYFNLKADRLRHVCRWWVEAGGHDAIASRPTDELRHDLLGVHGVGPETADDILLYAFDRPVFVIDAYTRRLFARLGMVEGREPYEALRAACEGALGADAPLFNEYHALIVQHAKAHCRPRPRCAGCCLFKLCPSGRAEGA